jgi:hypothetical protein
MMKTSESGLEEETGMIYSRLEERDRASDSEKRGVLELGSWNSGQLVR